MSKDAQVSEQVRDLFNKMAWLNKSRMEEQLKGYKSSEVHCIEAIKKKQDPNVTILAEALYMTRGALSRLTKKLVDKKVIESYQKEGNRKEIYFRLTEQGEAVYQIHEAQHDYFRERDRAVFEQVTEDNYNELLKFVALYDEHLDNEIKKQGLTLN